MIHLALTIAGFLFLCWVAWILFLIGLAIFERISESTRHLFDAFIEAIFGKKGNFARILAFAFLGLLAISVVAVVVGTEKEKRDSKNGDRLSVAENTLSAETQTRVASVIRIPPAPPIYAKGLALQQVRGLERIASSVSVFEQQLVDDGSNPIWNDSDLFDNRELAKAINSFLFSGDTAGVRDIGGERAMRFIHRLGRLNEALSDLPRDAGIPNFPISIVVDGRDFRTQIAIKQRGIAAALEANPQFSRAYVKWQFLIADAADAE